MRIVNTLRNPIPFRRLFYAVVLFWAAAASFEGFYSGFHFMDVSPRADSREDFMALVDGTGSRPFVYRQLIPSLANAMDAIVPRSVKDRIASTRSASGERLYAYLFNSPEAQDPRYSFRYLMIYLLVFVSCLLAACTMYLVGRGEGISPPSALLAAVFMILITPYVGVEGRMKLYDYAELFFFALSVLIARRFHWLSLVPVAALATWNKESYFFFVLTLFPLLQARSSIRGAVLRVGLLSAVSLAVYESLRLRYHGNPGNTVELHLLEQLGYLLRYPVNGLAHPVVAYGVLVPDAMTIVPLSLAAWAVWRAWPLHAHALRRWASVVAIVNVPLFLAFGSPGEARNLSMCSVFLLLSFAQSMDLRERDTAADRPEATPEGAIRHVPKEQASVQVSS